MAGAGFVILFVVSFVGLTVWSMIYLTTASHYFLTTIIDSSSGIDEIDYTGDSGVIDWWWKPLYCVWVLFVWVVPLSALLLPLARHPQAYAITWVSVLWIIYPISLLSGLYRQTWVFLLHPVMLWRMLRHFLAFGYVHLVTLAAFAACGALLVLAMSRSILWALPAAFAIATAIMLYARIWGRFAWLSLNFLPRKRKERSPYMEQPEPETRKPVVEPVPEMSVVIVPQKEEGIREGVPPGYLGGYQASPGGPVPTPDEWDADNRPYGVAGDASQPSFAETANQPPAAAPPTAPAPTPVVEEEDEWSLDKKPYDFVEQPPTVTMPSVAKTTEADEPLPVSQYYDERARKEKEEKRKAKEKESMLGLPKQSKKTPTFQTALWSGVWPFLIYGRTMRAWTNLVVLTIVELFFLMMVIRFFPGAD